MTERQITEEERDVLQCATDQAQHDIPYCETGEARLFQYHYDSGRWYVEVPLTHWQEGQGSAIALYRVWRVADSGGALAAMKVDIREAE